MTTIRMLTNRFGPDIPASSLGDVIDVDDKEAAELIAGGFAEKADPPPSPEPTSEATPFAEGPVEPPVEVQPEVAAKPAKTTKATKKP